MTKPYSADLRVRVVEAVDEGATRQEAAERFGVSVSSAVRWHQAWRYEGTIEAKPYGGSRSPLEDHAEEILAVIEEQPDLTLDEIVAAMRKDGRRTDLGVPTVSDRIAQMVVKQMIEPMLEPIFLPDSYGYRPAKSALDAVGVTRQRCWKYDWVLEFDIKGLLDASSHYTSRFFERSEEVWSTCRYLNSYAFCPSAIDVNGLELATLYTLQDRLPRDTE